MPGLLTQQQTAAPGAPGAAPSSAAAPQQAGEGQPNVSPEEQAIYDTFVDNAFSAIYDEKALPQVLKSLEGDGDPIDGLANTAVTTIIRVQDSAENAGQQLTSDVVFHAGAEILEDLADLAEKAGIHTYTTDELEGATFKAMDIYRETKGVDGGTQPQIVEDFKQIVELDKAGRMDEVAPGLTENFGDGGSGGSPAAPAQRVAPAGTAGAR